jgi:hypothetical protein
MLKTLQIGIDAALQMPAGGSEGSLDRINGAEPFAKFVKETMKVGLHRVCNGVLIRKVKYDISSNKKIAFPPVILRASPGGIGSGAARRAP